MSSVKTESKAGSGLRTQFMKEVMLELSLKRCIAFGSREIMKLMLGG